MYCDSCLIFFLHCLSVSCSHRAEATLNISTSESLPICTFARPLPHMHGPRKLSKVRVVEVDAGDEGEDADDTASAAGSAISNSNVSTTSDHHEGEHASNTSVTSPTPLSDTSESSSLPTAAVSAVGHLQVNSLSINSSTRDSVSSLEASLS